MNYAGMHSRNAVQIFAKQRRFRPPIRFWVQQLKLQKMRKADIKLMLSNLRPILVFQLLRRVITKMTDNPNFTTPTITIAAMMAMAEDLFAAIQNAVNGSQEDRLLRDELVEQAKSMLSEQAAYVRSVCGGNAAKLASSGFDLTKVPEPIGIPAQVANLKVKPTGLTGGLETRWDSVYGAHGYQMWTTDSDLAVAASWKSVGYTTRVSHVFTGLESQTLQWYCVSAIGAAGEGAQSGPAKNRAA